MRTCWPLDAKVCEKSPLRCRSVGTVVVVDWKAFWRKSSSENRKNVLFFRMGPDRTPPYWLRLKLGRGTPRELEKNVLASSAEFLRNSYPLPCQALVPLL